MCVCRIDKGTKNEEERKVENAGAFIADIKPVSTPNYLVYLSSNFMILLFFADSSPSEWYTGDTCDRDN